MNILVSSCIEELENMLTSLIRLPHLVWHILVRQSRPHSPRSRYIDTDR